MSSNNDVLSTYIPLKAMRSRLLTGFTLIELLIVIAILAVLATVAVVLINPTEMLKQARDSRRLSELKALNQALQIAQSQSSSLYFGSSSVVYVSIPDSSPTCANLNLLSLPTGWSYSCKTSANFRKVDGAGWTPVNFASLAIGAPFSALPVDPINNATSSQYYTYVTGGFWQLNGKLESTKFSDKAAKDGGNDPAMLEIGNNLTLAPFTHGLVGYWKFDEAAGATSTDSSGFGNNGAVITGTSTVQWTAGKVSGALNFDGADDYVSIQNSTALQYANNTFSWYAWVRLNTGVGPADNNGIFKESDAFINVGLRIYNGPVFNFSSFGRGAPGWDFLGGTTSPLQNTWYFVVMTYDGIIKKIYVNGALENTQIPNGPDLSNNTGNFWIGKHWDANSNWDGLIDDVRVYNRALSADEIKAMYDATK